MAVPIIPIIMAAAGLASGVAKGVKELRNKNAEAKVQKQKAELEIKERVRKAAKLMSKQKNSFLKGGVYFEGTPEAIIDETYDYMNTDVGIMKQNANNTLKKLAREGRTAFATSILEGIASGAMGFANAGGTIGSASGASASGGDGIGLLQKIKWGTLGNRGGFGQVEKNYNLIV